MKSSLLIVSPEYPPLRGGVADHTRRLAQELSAHFQISVLTSSTAAGGGDEFPVHARLRDWCDEAALLAAIRGLAPAGPVLWQYVPHLYGRGGVNFALPRVLLALRRAGRRQLVIAHEIAAPFSLWPQRAWYALAHRWQWRRILEVADAVGISTEAWLTEWRQRAPQFQEKLFLLPSPSSVPVVATTARHREEWRAEHGLPAETRVIAYFGTISAAKQFDWVLAAWRQAQAAEKPVALAVIGAQPAVALPAKLGKMFLPLGHLPPEEVSRALQAADLLALPFVDGVSERRTSFMAGLDHGCAVVTTRGHNTGTTLRHADFFAAASATAKSAFVQNVMDLLNDAPKRIQLGLAARAVSQRSYAWNVVAQSLRDRGIPAE